MYRRVSFSVLIVLLTVAPAWADWDQTMPHKMHYPQLPDPNGWDVDVTRGFVADDWQCSQSGPVSDIHFWISAEHDYWGNGIDFIDVTIYDDVPANPGDPDMPWSHPGGERWFRRVDDLEFTIRVPEPGNQGWFTPQEPAYYNYPDHTQYCQINIMNILEPFEQEFGNIYWLEIHIIPNAVGEGEESPFFGWKTSLDHWNDDAVFELEEAGMWGELWDPRQEIVPPVSLDMAFVITPEPATLALLLIGAALSLGKRR